MGFKWVKIGKNRKMAGSCAKLGVKWTKDLKKPIVIAITGTPCTGKSSLAAEICRITGFKLVDGNKIIQDCNLSEGYDSFRRAKIVDSRRFARAVISFIKHDLEAERAKMSNLPRKTGPEHGKKAKTAKMPEFKQEKLPQGYVVDSHMSHFLPMNFVNKVIVTKTGLKQLKQRLTKRYEVKNWSKKALDAKVRENLDSEIFGVCYNEAFEQEHDLFVSNTCKKSPRLLAKEFIKSATFLSGRK